MGGGIKRNRATLPKGRSEPTPRLMRQTVFKSRRMEEGPRAVVRNMHTHSYGAASGPRPNMASILR